MRIQEFPTYTRYTFDRIERRQKLIGICKNCKKKRQRTISVGQTVNPYNKNPDGTVKTYLEVEQSVEEQLRVKVEDFKDNFYCKGCKEYV